MLSRLTMFSPMDFDVPALHSSLPPGLPHHDPTLMLYASYIGVIAMSAWSWDSILSIASEVEIFQDRLSSSFWTPSRLVFSDHAYILARLTTCANMMTAMMLAVEPYNCKVVARLSVIFASLAFPCNSLLFLLRVRCVFIDSPRIIIAFAVSWLFTIGAFIQPLVLVITNTVSSKFICVVNVRPFGVLGLLGIAAFDTLIFLAISLKLTVIAEDPPNNWMSRILAVLRGGKGLGRVSQALLRTGQLYYLASVSVTLGCMVVMFVPAVPPSLQGCMVFPSLAMQNVMACRVFRLLRLGFIEEHQEATSYSVRALDFRIPHSLRFSPTREIESYSDVIVLAPIR